MTLTFSTLTELEYCKFYANGEWKESKSGQTIEIQSPYLYETVGKIQAVTMEEANEAVLSAREAQSKWAQISVEERAIYLHKWADNLMNMQREISVTIMKEVGKSYRDAVAEVAGAVDFIRCTIKEALQLNSGAVKTNHTLNSPAGVVLVISPFNQPVYLAVAKLAPALIAGSAVIFKPATQGARSGAKIIEALDQAAIPVGLVSLITGFGAIIGEYLAQHNGIDMISFTGRAHTGNYLARKVAGTSFHMDLNEKFAGIVCEDADFAEAAHYIINSAFSYSGQCGTAIKHILVHENVADTFIEILKGETEKLSVGSPEDDCSIVPLINRKAADFSQVIIADALGKGAAIITGNKREGNLIYPTLLDFVNEEMRITREELFGPILSITRVSSYKEAIKAAKESSSGLQAIIFTNDKTNVTAMANELKEKAIQINRSMELESN